MIGLRFFPLKSADIRRAGTRDEPPKNVGVGGYSCFIFYVFSSMLRRLVSDISISLKLSYFMIHCCMSMTFLYRTPIDK